MKIGAALETILNGKQASRAGWPPRSYIYYLKFFDGYGSSNAMPPPQHYQPVIVFVDTQGLHYPGWLPTSQDLFATDFKIVKYL